MNYLLFNNHKYIILEYIFSKDVNIISESVSENKFAMCCNDYTYKL